MAMKPGSFAWYDLMTSDTKAAETFYRGTRGQSPILLVKNKSALTPGITGGPRSGCAILK
jgi:hypothetical protein